MTDDVVWVGPMPDAYDRHLVPAVFRPFARDLARRAAALRPDRILEIAAGSGAVTTELLTAVPDARVTATDLNVAMVDFGAARVPAARWEVADATRLPFPDGTFDLAVCQFGVMFFPDRTEAFAEIARVLALQGRLLFSTWDTVRTHGFAAPLVEGLELAFPGDVPPFVSAVPHGYADPGRIAADVRAGGLEVVSIETVTLVGHGSAAEVATGFCTGTPLRGEIEKRGDLAATVTLVADEMTARLGEGEVSVRMSAHVVDARRPA